MGNYTTIYTGTATDFAVTNRSATTHCYHVRTLRAAQVGLWSNQVCVSVAQPTPTPTFTPLPTATPLPVNGAMLYIGSDSGGTVGGIAFADEDILAFDTATSSWSLYLDGSDVGITGNIDGFQLESDGSMLLTLEGNATLAGVGAVTGNDILRFTPTSLGATTAGTFTWVLDGSDVELEATSENIDGISRAPDGRLLITTNGSLSVTGITGEDKDLLVFNATSLGETSAGSWALYFDGSDVGLNVAGEDIWDMWVDSVTGYIYLSTFVNYSIPGPGGTTINGDGDDIFVCIPGSLGENTTCTYSPYWNGDLYGFDEYLDTLSIVLSGGAPPTPTPTSATTPTVVPTATPTHTPLPTATSTDTPAVTPTDTLVITPTNTPAVTPTATPTGSSSAMLYVGSDSGGTVGGIAFADEDILAFDTATSSWSLYLDGSDVGITGNIDGFQLESDGSMLLTLEGNATLAGVGAVTGNDILRFTPTSLGATTAGTFTWVLDGSDVELEATSENIDGISRAPDGRLLITTNGSLSVTGITGEDKDLLVFNATSLGETSAGSWALYFDGSDVGLNVAGEDIWDMWVDSVTGYIYLSTYVNYSIPGPGGTTINGDGDDIFICIPGSLGENTTCTYSPYWNGDLYGFDEYMDSLSIGGTVVTGAGAAHRPLPATETRQEKIYLPLIAR